MSVSDGNGINLRFRTVPAIFGDAESGQDPTWEWDFASYLKETYSSSEIVALYSRYRSEESPLANLLRRVFSRAMFRSAGHGIQVEAEVVFKHPETIEVGNKVFIGAQTMIQGRFDGRCRLGDHVWIGPHSYFDARDLIIEDYVGWGPGAKVLGSSHTGLPNDTPIIATELIIRPVIIGFGSDVGTNATILPGVHVGAHSIVGAGAVVTTDVPEYAIVAGVPAKVIRYRK